MLLLLRSIYAVVVVAPFAVAIGLFSRASLGLENSSAKRSPSLCCLLLCKKGKGRVVREGGQKEDTMCLSGYSNKLEETEHTKWISEWPLLRKWLPGW